MKLCNYCNTEDPHIGDYMVKAAVWSSALLEYKDVCCILCLEAKLGRALTIEDMSPVPINVRFLIANAVHDQSGEIIRGEFPVWDFKNMFKQFMEWRSTL